MHFELFPSQLEILGSEEELTIAVSGRGSGKSHSASHWLVKQLKENPNEIGLATAPSYAQANELLQKLFTVLDTVGWKYYYNKSPPWKTTFPSHQHILSVQLANTGRYSYLQFATLDNYENLRGISRAYLLMDEAAMTKEEAYSGILLPALRGCRPGHVYKQLLLTTPRGASNWVSRLLDNENAKIVRTPSSENFIQFPEEKLAFLKEMMSDRQYRQEILAEICNDNNARVFHSFNPAIHVVNEASNKGILWVSSDQNVQPMVALMIRSFEGVDTVVREIVIPDDANTFDLVREIGRANPAKEQIILTGDRAGSNRSIVSTTTFYEQLIKGIHSLGIPVVDRTLKKNPSVYDTAEGVCARFEKNKLFVHKSCKNLIEGFAKSLYLPGTLEPNKKQYDAHACDCLRYFVYVCHKPPQLIQQSN